MVCVGGGFNVQLELDIPCEGFSHFKTGYLDEISHGRKFPKDALYKSSTALRKNITLFVLPVFSNVLLNTRLLKISS